MGKLLSVGLDVGTTTTQLIVSQLQVENQAAGFTAPKMQITQRQILYESPVYFTPMAEENLVDGQAIRRIVAEEYEKAGISRQQVDTGAVIITGETSRKENARTVLTALSGFAGDFVAATAGPDLESVLAAKGAGAVDFSEKTGKRVLHMDIGGGTSNLSLIENGKILATGCLNVGGRLVKFDPQGRVTYVSAALDGLTDIRLGDSFDQNKGQAVAALLVQVLEMAAGLREKTPLLEQLTTKEAAGNLLSWRAGAPNDGTMVISFSGGVADCIEKQHPALTFGDIGPALGQAIRQSRLCAGAYRLAEHTIRATVIGAGCYSAALSGSTVFCQGVELPLKNLPVAALTAEEQEDPKAIVRQMTRMDSPQVMLAMPGYPAASYCQVTALAQAIAEAAGSGPVYICLEQDMAKALGQRLRLLRPELPCLCIDRLELTEGSFLDIGKPVGPCFPVVVKTLILTR